MLDTYRNGCQQVKIHCGLYNDVELLKKSSPTVSICIFFKHLYPILSSYVQNIFGLLLFVIVWHINLPCILNMPVMDLEGGDQIHG